MTERYYIVLFLIISIVLLCLFLFIFLLLRIKKCPSDKIMVIYGNFGRNNEQIYKCIHGGAFFVWPFIQAYQYLDLNPICTDIELTEVLTKDKGRIHFLGKITVAISTEQHIMNNAAERLLGLRTDNIRQLAQDIITGQLHLIFASDNFQKLKDNSDDLLNYITDKINYELNKIGLNIVNIKIDKIEEN